MSTQPVLDEYGFPLRMSEEAHNFYLTNVDPVLRKNEEDWFKYITSQGGSSGINLNSKQYKKMVRRGIPHTQRPILWCKMAKVYERMGKNPSAYHDINQAEGVVSPQVMEEINKDVVRTFIGASSFEPEALTRLLKVFALLHPNIGYCQSLNFIAAMVLSVIKDEEPSYYLFAHIIENFLPPHYYDDSMEDFSADLNMMKVLIDERAPEIVKVGQAMKHDWIQTTSGWLLTLFSNSLPPATVYRIWDSIFLEGPKIIFRIAIAFFRMNEQQLLAHKDPRTFGTLISDLQNNLVDQYKLMDIAFGIKIFSRKHLAELRKNAHQSTAVNALDYTPRANFGIHSLFGQVLHL